MTISIHARLIASVCVPIVTTGAGAAAPAAVAPTKAAVPAPQPRLATAPMPPRKHRIARSHRATVAMTSLRTVAVANRAATLEPDRQAFVNAVQVYPYADGVLYHVYTAPERVTDMVLGAVASGDTVRWTINLGVQPTITIRPGAPVRLVVHKDLILAPWRS